MVYHHLFVIPERLGNNYVSVINFLGFDFQAYLANFSKICVCIFVFCSGIGLFYSLKSIDSLKDMYKKVILHGLKFMMNFWIVLLFIFPIGLYLHYFSLKPITILQLMTASYGSIMEWWFVKLYIALLLIAPVIVRFFQNVSVVKKIVPAIIFVSVIIVYNIVNRLFVLDNAYLLAVIFIDNLKNIDCILTFVAGMVCANYNTIRHFQCLKGKEYLFFCFFWMTLSVVVRVIFSNTPTSMKVDFVVVPMFILPLTSLINGTKLSVVFCFFAKHSTNIWLTHTFWCYYFGQRIVLLPKYSIFIYLWLLVLSLLSSYIINLVYIPIYNLIFDKSHKLSYQGYLFIKQG